MIQTQVYPTPRYHPMEWKLWEEMPHQARQASLPGTPAPRHSQPPSRAPELLAVAIQLGLLLPSLGLGCSSAQLRSQLQLHN